MPQVNPIIRRGLQDKATRLMLDGKPDGIIAIELGVTRQAFYAFKKKTRNLTERLRASTESVQTTVLKGALRLEISQENALSDLSGQMKEYTDRYDKAMLDGDEKAAYAWSSRRVDLLEKMLKVTGLYDARVEPMRSLKLVFEEVEANCEFTRRLLADPVACDLACSLIDRIGLPKDEIPGAFQTLRTKGSP